MKVCMISGDIVSYSGLQYCIIVSKVKKLSWDAPDGNQANMMDTFSARSLMNAWRPPEWRENLQHLQDQTKRFQLTFLPSDVLSRAARRV